MSGKAFGQVFTPKAIVGQMLDTVGYSATHDILTKKIMEPSFGAGVFLEEIIVRLVAAAREEHYTPEQISHVLERNVFGVELDENLYASTVASLNSLVESFNLPAVSWQLTQGDTLLYKEKYNQEFDFVVGNPPYVRIHNIPDSQRRLVKSFKFATGTTDLYIVFFELGIGFLNSTGKLAYITPNSFMKNHSQKEFRKYLIEQSLLTGLSDYRSEKIFSDADTYATITYLERNSQAEVSYSLVENNVTSSTIISYESLRASAGSAWNFADPDNIMEAQALKARSVEEYLSVQYGIATLRDKLYIDNAPVLGDTTTLINGHLIENGILRPVVKGSTYKGGTITGRIIFPYLLSDGKYVLMEEEYLRNTFPLAYAYLSMHRAELEQRSMEKNSRWYQYGRSQGLNATDKPKLVFGHVIRPSVPVRTYILPAGTIVYSGFFSVPKPEYDMEEARHEIEQEEFLKYAKTVGKDMSGGFVALTAKHVKAYRF